MINLEDYVDQEVIIIIISERLSCLEYPSIYYRVGKVTRKHTVRDSISINHFVIGKDKDSYTKDGHLFGGEGEQKILSIHRLAPKLIGLAQKAPNIDLRQFVGKKVLVKYNDNNVSIGRVEKYDNGNLCSFNIGVGGTSFIYNGQGIGCFSSNSILEIYEEGAYQLFTSSIPEPENKKMKELAEQIKELNETELAELFKIIKRS
jgi:hypothetical protein